jgi:hypothetical protein
MRASGSLVLRVDGQVFEWTARRPIVEFVFDRSSGWTVVDSGDPVP